MMSSLQRCFALSAIVLCAHCAQYSAAQSQIPPAATVESAAATGISPPALTATGIADSSVTTVQVVLSNIDQATTERSDLAAAKAAVDTAGENVTSLQRALKADPENESLLSEYDNATAELASAQNAYANAQIALRNAAFDGIESELVEAFLVWEANATRAVPAEFRVLELSDDQWHEVEYALRAESRAQRTGEPLDPEQAQLLQDIRSEIDVIDAKYRLDAHLAAVETAFEQFESD